MGIIANLLRADFPAGTIRRWPHGPQSGPCPDRFCASGSVASVQPCLSLMEPSGAITLITGRSCRWPICPVVRVVGGRHLQKAGREFRLLVVAVGIGQHHMLIGDNRNQPADNRQPHHFADQMFGPRIGRDSSPPPYRPASSPAGSSQRLHAQPSARQSSPALPADTSNTRKSPARSDVRPRHRPARSAWPGPS